MKSAMGAILIALVCESTLWNSGRYPYHPFCKERGFEAIELICWYLL